MCWTILTTSLLDATGTIFVFAPNLEQALIGWCAVSLSAAILIRLSHQRIERHRDQFESDTDHMIARPRRQFADGNGNPFPELAGWLAAIVERSVDRIGTAITRRVPNWLGEQVDHLESSPVSFQVLSAILGGSAILLTWLL